LEKKAPKKSLKNFPQISRLNLLKRKSQARLMKKKTKAMNTIRQTTRKWIKMTQRTAMTMMFVSLNIIKFSFEFFINDYFL